MGHLGSTADCSKPPPNHRKIALHFVFISCSYYFLKNTFIPHVRHGAPWVSQGWQSLIKLIKDRDKICGEYWECL